MEHTLAEGDEGSLAAVGRDDELPLELSLGRFEFDGGEGLVDEPAQFLPYQLHGSIGMAGRAAEIDATDPRIGIGCIIALHVVRIAVLFAEREIEAGVHSRATENVGQESQRDASFVVERIGTSAHQDVVLVGVLVAAYDARQHSIGSMRGGHGVSEPVAFDGRERPVGQVGFAGDEEDHIVRPIMTTQEVASHLSGRARNGTFRPQYVVSEGVVAEEDVLKLVEYEFGGIVAIGIDFVDDDGFFLGKFFLGETAVLHDVEEEIGSTIEMCLGEDAIDEGGLLLCEGIELGSYLLHPSDDLQTAAQPGALEEHVLGEMSQSVVVRTLVARAYAYGKTRVGDFSGMESVHDV